MITESHMQIELNCQIKVEKRSHIHMAELNLSDNLDKKLFCSQSVSQCSLQTKPLKYKHYEGRNFDCLIIL